MNPSRLLSICALLIVAGPLRAETHLVPQMHATIQEAVNAAGDGDTIQISSGTYAEAVVMTGRSNVLIQAKGKVILDPPGDDGVALTLDGCTDCSVLKLRATGAATGLQLIGCTGGLVSKCSIEAVSGSGLVLDDCDGVTVESCRIADTGFEGIVLAQDDLLHSDNCTLRKNSITGVGDTGIRVRGTANVVEQNRISKTANYGCLVVSAPETIDTVVTGNRISDTGTTGIRATGTHTVLTANTVIRAGEFALQVSSGTNHVVQQCKAIKSVDRGLYADADVVGLTLTGNRITKPGTEGIVVDVESTTATDNTVSGAGTDGIVIEGDGGTWTGNKAMGSDGNGFLVAGTGNTLTFNKAKGSKHGFDLNEFAGVDANEIDATNVFGTQGP